MTNSSIGCSKCGGVFANNSEILKTTMTKSFHRYFINLFTNIYWAEAISWGQITNTPKEKQKDLFPPSRRIHILVEESYNILLNLMRAIGEGIKKVLDDSILWP